MFWSVAPGVPWMGKLMFHRLRAGLCVLFVICFGMPDGLSARKAAAPVDSSQDLAAGVRRLQSWYVPETGLYRTTGWWNAGNATTVLVDYSRVSGKSDLLPVLSNTFVKAQNKFSGFLNRYYDDEGWWALAWIDAYDLTRDERYRAMAASIFTDMSGGWDETCGGGVWWSKDKKYKNAIANELFLSVAAHLAVRATTPAQRQAYEMWAEKEWRWFGASGMINAQHLINDGLDTSTCKNNRKTTWTYNQGVLLGGLGELNKVASSPELLGTANAVAGAALDHLTDAKGILHDVCEPKCGADGVQFKGIFVRNLRVLQEAAPKDRYASFFAANAESIREESQGEDSQFGQVWSGPFDGADAASQSSALDALIAATQTSTPASGQTQKE